MRRTYSKHLTPDLSNAARASSPPADVGYRSSDCGRFRETQIERFLGPVDSDDMRFWLNITWSLWAGYSLLFLLLVPLPFAFCESVCRHQDMLFIAWFLSFLVAMLTAIVTCLASRLRWWRLPTVTIAIAIIFAIQLFLPGLHRARSEALARMNMSAYRDSYQSIVAIASKAPVPGLHWYRQGRFSYCVVSDPQPMILLYGFVPGWAIVYDKSDSLNSKNYETMFILGECPASVVCRLETNWYFCQLESSCFVPPGDL